MAENLKLAKASVFSTRPGGSSTPSHIGIYDARKLPIEKTGTDTYVVDLTPVWDAIDEINGKLQAAKTAAEALTTTIAQRIDPASSQGDDNKVEKLISDFYNFILMFTQNLNTGSINIGGDYTLKRISDKCAAINPISVISDDNPREDVLLDDYIKEIATTLNVLLDKLRQLNPENISDEEFFNKENPVEHQKKFIIRKAGKESEISVN